MAISLNEKPFQFPLAKKNNFWHCLVQQKWYTCILNDMSRKQVANNSDDNPLAFNSLSKKPQHQNITYPILELSAWLGQTCTPFLSPAISWITFAPFRSLGDNDFIYSCFCQDELTWTRSGRLVSRKDCVTTLPFWDRFWQISRMIFSTG